MKIESMKVKASGVGIERKGKAAAGSQGTVGQDSMQSHIEVTQTATFCCHRGHTEREKVVGLAERFDSSSCASDWQSHHVSMLFTRCIRGPLT